MLSPEESTSIVPSATNKIQNSQKNDLSDSGYESMARKCSCDCHCDGPAEHLIGSDKAVCDICELTSCQEDLMFESIRDVD